MYKRQLFKLIEAIFELIIPIIMARVIDIGVKNGDQPYVLKMGGGLVLLYIVGLCSTLVLSLIHILQHQTLLKLCAHECLLRD